MDYKTIIIILIIIITLYIIYYIYYKEELTNSDKFVLVTSSIDNNKYYVLKEYSDKQDASNILAKLNINITLLLEYFDNHINDFSTYQQGFIKKLKKRYSYKILSEAINKQNYTSYLIDKKHIYLCLRQKSVDFVDINVLMFVLLHELAHLSMDRIISEKEHETDNDFKESFKMLIDTSIKIKIYKNIDFFTYPQKYCGMTIG